MTLYVLDWDSKWILDLARIWIKLKYVESVEIHVYRDYQDNERFMTKAALQALPPCLESIGKSAKKLSVENLRVEDGTSLRSFLSLLPKLTEARFSWCSVEDETRLGDKALVLVAFPELRKLHFDQCDRSYFHALLQPVMVPHLRDLTLCDRWDGPRDALEASSILQSVDTLYMYGGHNETPDHNPPLSMFHPL